MLRISSKRLRRNDNPEDRNPGGKKKEIIAIAGFLICMAIFSIIIFYSSLSVGSLVNMQN